MHNSNCINCIPCIIISYVVVEIKIPCFSASTTFRIRTAHDPLLYCMVNLKTLFNKIINVLNYSHCSAAIVIRVDPSIENLN